MNFIKKIWDKLTYWQKGTMVGLLIGLLVLLIYDHMSWDVFWVFIIQPVSIFSISFHFISFHFILLVFHIMSNNSLQTPPLGFFSLVIPLWYALVGFVIGIMYSLSKKYTKHSRIVFLVLCIIFLLVILFLNFFGILLLLTKAA